MSVTCVKYVFNKTPHAWKDGNGWRGPVNELLYYFEGICQESGQILHATAGSGHDAGSPYLAVEDPFDYYVTDDGSVVCEDQYGQECSHDGWLDGSAPIPNGFNIQRWEKSYNDNEWKKVGNVINPHQVVYP